MQPVKLKMTGKRYVVPFLAAAALSAGGISALLYTLIEPGAAVGFVLGGVIGHYGYEFAMKRWGGWEWVDRA